nr:hypothetical protein BgiMline_004558 [Biomphalaria glabrata]
MRLSHEPHQRCDNCHGREAGHTDGQTDRISLAHKSKGPFVSADQDPRPAINWRLEPYLDGHYTPETTLEATKFGKQTRTRGEED